MKIIQPKYEILQVPSYDECLKMFELAGRTCYKSDPIDDFPEAFVARCLGRKHWTLLEHLQITLRITTSRGVMAELTRHRLVTFHIESTRYVNYNDGIEVMYPAWLDLGEICTKGTPDCEWVDFTKLCEKQYCSLIEKGLAPQFARGVLPNDLKTVIVMTCNFRELRHIFELRALGLTGAPHPDIKAIFSPLLKQMASTHRVFFEDLNAIAIDQEKERK